MESSEIHTPLLSPSTLAIMKHQHLHGADSGFFSESNGAINGASASAGATSKAVEFGKSSRSASLARSSSRHFSRSSRRSTGGAAAGMSSASSTFLSAHRRQMSAELTAQAESKFNALMDLMASASREASSLRESWSRIISERESFNSEREELLEQITEVSEELEQNSSHRHQHSDELVQRKKQVDTLLGELSIAVNSVTAEKKRLAERDLELQRTREELRFVQDTSSRTKIDYERVRSDMEALELTLTTTQADRDAARIEVERSQTELHRVVRERTELSTRLADVTANYDISRKEVLSITDRLKIYDLEREESLQEVDRLKEDARKHRLRAEESSKEIIDATERYERSQREVHKLRESIRIAEADRDEYAHTIEHRNRELKLTTTSRDEALERIADVTTKYDNIKRETLSLKETLRDVELEKNQQLENAERLREQYRLMVVERDEFKDEATTVRRKADDNQRQITLLTETLRKTEQSLSEMRSEALTNVERVKSIERERDDWRGRHGTLSTELSTLRERLAIIQAEVRTITDAHDRVRGELHRRNEEFEEITDTITTTRDGSAELEFEIESLRTMLRESREQKERAIAARNSADRERDESIAKYEEKCREMERFEESAASHYHHSSARSGGESRVTSSRIVSHSGTTVNDSG